MRTITEARDGVVGAGRRIQETLKPRFSAGTQRWHTTFSPSFSFRRPAAFTTTLLRALRLAGVTA